MFESPSSGKKELVRRTSSYHTSGVGTQAYGAPEQLLHGIIDDKSDVYSLGIVLFEMFHPFGTTMERSREDYPFLSLSKYHRSMNLSFTQGHHGPAEGGAAAGGDGGEVPRDGRPRPLHDGLDAVCEAVGRLAAPVDVLE